MRKISYVEALNEALFQLLESDTNTCLLGNGVTSPWYCGKSTVGLLDKFGPNRILDTPISEQCVTGSAIGSALVGMRPILNFPRMDFMWLAMDQIANHASTWKFMFGNQLKVPLTIWAIINRGGEQGAQHSQALHGIFAHIPGLKVVAPSNPYDAKGLLISAVRDNDPVIFIDDRWLYETKCYVPQEMYEVPIGEAKVVRKGGDLTVITSSYLVGEALKAADKSDMDIEVIDLRSLKPLDRTTIIKSVNKTKYVLVVDGGWKSNGFAAEVMAVIGEDANNCVVVKRLCLPDTPAPASTKLEKDYYIDYKKILKEIENVC